MAEEIGKNLGAQDWVIGVYLMDIILLCEALLACIACFTLG